MRRYPIFDLPEVGGSSPTPKYPQLINAILRRIDTGKRNSLFFALVCLCTSWPGPASATPVPPWSIDRTTCEYRVNPLGIDVPHPRFGWTFLSHRRDQRQSAYRILVASSLQLLSKDHGDIWDSGPVSSADNITVPFDGSPLLPFKRYFWKVKGYNQGGDATPWSRPGWFETAFLPGEPWKGCWISDGQPAPGRDEDFYKDRPAPIFRRDIVLRKTVAEARLYISGLGYYEAYLDGHKVGNQVLDPGWTNYSKTVLYSVYDITSALPRGPHSLGLLLGNGWYDPLPLRLFGAFDFRKVLTVGEPKVLANIRIRYTDGTVEVIATDSTWKAGQSHILKNNIYLGESQDGRKFDSHWCRPGPTTTSWSPAAVAAPPGGTLAAQSAPPIRITHVFRPVSVKEPVSGVYVVDLGQNFAGWLSIALTGAPGQHVHFRYGELLDSNGRVNGLTTVAGHIKAIWHIDGGPGAPATAYQEDDYICAGRPGEVFQPHFTFHAFRYVEITGLHQKPRPETIRGLRLNADLPEAGDFTCSNPLLNRIQQMCRASFLSNVFSVQSDCPGRERQGYGADMVVSAEAFAYNFDMSLFYAKTITDFANDVRPNGGMPECAPYNGITTEGFADGAGPIGWQLAFPFLQEKLYRFYGNKDIIAAQYARTKQLVEFLRSQSRDELIDHGIGDHVAVNAKHVPLTSAAFYYHHVLLLAEFAHLLGRREDSIAYHNLADSIRDAFNRRYLQLPTGAYDTAHNETTQVFPLWYGLVPETIKDHTLNLLLDEIVETNHGHLSTGIFGTKMLFDVLRRFNRNDLALTIATQRSYPGYGYMLANGATTLWETWDEPDQNSWNHPMFGSVSEWFYRSLAGINAAEDACGMDKLILKPFTHGDLRFVKAEYRSVRGPIASRWQKQGKRFRWTVSVPPNTHAQLFVPAGPDDAITESGLPIDQVRSLHLTRREKQYAVFDVGSGEYHFAVETANAEKIK